MGCCTPAGYRSIFSARLVERDVRRYRRRGLVGSERWLFDSLAGDDVAGRTVLEVGGGIGGLQLELVGAGAAHATNVEIIDSYEQAAGALIAERGLDQQIDRRIGDFALQSQELPAADIVVMHRVICCYPDAGTLVAEACGRSGERVAITVPREARWIKLGIAAINLWSRMRRIDFRTYVHPLEPMLDLAAARGFRPARRQSGRLWVSIILTRR